MSHQSLEYGAPSPRHRLTRRQVRTLFVALAASPVILFVLFDLGIGMEQPSRLWPWVDTTSATGYSESAFQALRVGMTRQQVDQIMVPPLDAVTVSVDGRRYLPVPVGPARDAGWVQYSYTSDGRCPWGDFAWHGREVEFQDGVVVKVVSHIYED